MNVNEIYRDKDIFAERERVLEDEYFRKRDRELIERLRDRTRMSAGAGGTPEEETTAASPAGSGEVELSGPERDLLIELVQRAIRELRVEVRHTSTARYRSKLRQREEVAEGLIDKLRAAHE